MKKLKLLCLLGIVLAIGGAVAIAQEAVSLTTPVAKTTSTQHVSAILLDLDNNRITVSILSNQSETTTKVYDATTNPTGATLLHSLNIGNFSVNSLIKAVYNRLQTDGVIAAGSITGAPQ